MDDHALAAALPGVLDRVWAVSEAVVCPLGGGMNSATALVETGPSAPRTTWVAKWVPAGGAAGLRAGAELADRLEAAGVPCGSPVPTRTGELVSALDAGSVVLLRFVPGRELTGNVEDQPLLARTLARAHVGLGTRLRRDPFLADLGSEPRAAEVGSWIRPSISAVLRQYEALPALTWGVLHADPAPEAFRLDETTGSVGLIDWAGASEGPLLYDVASALMYLGGPESGRPFLDAYTAVGAVPADEIDQHLLILRRFRAAVQADYFAGRVLADDRTGIADPSENLKGLHDAYAMLTDLGALETGEGSP